MAFGGENAESYYDDGLTAAMKGDIKQAVTCFKKAIELDGQYLTAYHQLGKCYLRLGNGAKAVEMLRPVVDRKPNQIPVRVDLGHALLRLGKVEEARQEFADLLNLDANNVRVHLGLAQVCFSESRWAQAVAHAEAALAQSESNVAALYLLGRAAKLAGDSLRSDEILRQADALLEKSAELTPDQPESHYLRGEVSFSREQFSTAIECYRLAEDRTEPDRLYSAFGENFVLADVHLKQALCYRRLGKKDRAAEMAKQVLAVDPNHKLAQSLVEPE